MLGQNNKGVGLLLESYPTLYQPIKNELVEFYHFQPSDVSELSKDLSAYAPHSLDFSVQSREVISLVNAIRKEPADEQIQMIDYLMGKRDQPPKMVERWADSRTNLEKFGVSDFPAGVLVHHLRETLSTGDLIPRVMILNSILAGNDSFIGKQEGMRTLMDHLLDGVSAERRPLARVLSDGIFKGEGSRKSLALSYILAQKPGKNGKLSEGETLRALFDAYGVPGQKLGQYLGFTSALKDYEASLGSLQDEASPINYYEVIKAIDARFGTEWPSDLQIEKRIGSGSVNLAIRYRDAQTEKHEVLNLLRPNVENATQFDFERLNRALKEIASDPASGGEFEYLPGLLSVIRRSVELEFNKENAFKIQHDAESVYNRTFRVGSEEWTIEVPKPIAVKNGGFFMAEAPGVTARKLKATSPELYKKVMSVIAKQELDVLFGTDKSGNPKPVQLFANPDLHDGQVMVHVDGNKIKVSVLDFGQALSITKSEREMGLDILTIIQKTKTPKEAAALLNKIGDKLAPGHGLFSEADLKPLLERQDNMDIFVRLISLSSSKGVELPLSSIHWILGVNRLVGLGDRLGLPMREEFRNLIIAEKFGLGFKSANLFRGLQDQISKAFGSETQSTAECLRDRIKSALKITGESKAGTE